MCVVWKECVRVLYNWTTAVFQLSRAGVGIVQNRNSDRNDFCCVCTGGAAAAMRVVEQPTPYARESNPNTS